MTSVLIRLRVYVTHERFGGDRFVAALPRDRVRDLIARVLVETGIEDDPEGWELADGETALHPGSTVSDVLAGEQPWNGWALRPLTRAAHSRKATTPRPAPPVHVKPPVAPRPPVAPGTHFTDILLTKKIISPEQLEESRRSARDTGVRIQDTLAKFGYATPVEVIRAVAEARGLAFVDLTKVEIPKSVIELVPESVARENLVLPLALDGNTLTVVMGDPDNYDTIQKLEFILNKTILPVVATQEQIQEAINRYYGQTETESVDSMLVEFTDTAIVFTQTGPAPAAPAAPAPRQEPPVAPEDEEADLDDDFEDESTDEDEDRGVVFEAVPAPTTTTRSRAKLDAPRKARSTQRRVTVRYYNRMNPDRVFPMLVTLTREEVERIVKQHVEQKATGPLTFAADSPLEIEPVLPGCVCHPPKVLTKIGAADQQFTFHVVPHVLGRVTGARVLVRQDHETIAEIELDVRVVQRTLVVVSGLSALFLPVASAVMDHFGIDFKPRDGGNAYLTAMNFLFREIPPAALTAGLALLTGVLYWFTRPTGRDVFWDVKTKPAQPG